MFYKYLEKCDVLNRSARPMKWVMMYKVDCIPSELHKIGKKRKEETEINSRTVFKSPLDWRCEKEEWWI